MTQNKKIAAEIACLQAQLPNLYDFRMHAEDPRIKEGWQREIDEINAKIKKLEQLKAEIEAKAESAEAKAEAKPDPDLFQETEDGWDFLGAHFGRGSRGFYD